MVVFRISQMDRVMRDGFRPRSVKILARMPWESADVKWDASLGSALARFDIRNFVIRRVLWAGFETSGFPPIANGYRRFIR